MEPVFRLVEDHGLLSVDHLVGDLFTAMGGQAVHEERVRLGVAHEVGVHLVR